MDAVDLRAEKAQDQVGVIGDLRGALRVYVPSGNEDRRAKDLSLVGGADESDSPEVNESVSRRGQKDEGG
jgi:hypothetical protein